MLSVPALLEGLDHFVVHFLQRQLCPRPGLSLLLFIQNHRVRLDEVAEPARLLLVLLLSLFPSLVEVAPALSSMFEWVEGAEVAEVVRLELLLPVGRRKHSLLPQLQRTVLRVSQIALLELGLGDAVHGHMSLHFITSLHQFPRTLLLPAADMLGFEVALLLLPALL